MTDEGEALLVTGLYGSGKTTLVEELAEQLERRGLPYAAIDVDWLGWFDVPGEPDLVAVGNANLGFVLEQYWSKGVRYILMACAVEDEEELLAIRQLVPCGMRVLRLETPMELIRARLVDAPTTGRAVDLAEAEREHRTSRLGAGRPDTVWPTTCDQAAERVLEWLGWP